MAGYYIPLVASPPIGDNSGGGGSGGVLVVNVTAADEVRTCDKTAGEMWAAYLSGGVVLSAVDDGDTYCDTIISATEKSGSYTFYDATGNYTLSAATADDYPSAGSGPK